ncbi:MAG: nucleotidyl transferase AbiEii/AbiGii toxin family protein, partial [Desulfuromonadales bacterium]
PLKFHDRDYPLGVFLELLAARQATLTDDPTLHGDFRKEMRRFLPAALVAETVDKADFWQYLVTVVVEECRRAAEFLAGAPGDKPFRM